MTCYNKLNGKGTAASEEACIDKATGTKADAKSAADKGKRKAAEAKCKGMKAVEDNILGLIKTIEQTLDCQGLCQPTTFWWNKDITKGSPQIGCLIGVKNEFKSTSGAAAIVMIVAIVISFCLAICTFGSICTKKD